MLSTVAEMSRERYPALTVMEFQTQERPFLHIWRTISPEHSGGLTYLPSFNVIVTCNDAENLLQFTLMTFHGKTLAVTSIPADSLGFSDVDILDNLDANRLQPCPGLSVKDPETSKSLIIEPFGDDLVIRNRSCKYVVLVNSPDYNNAKCEICAGHEETLNRIESEVKKFRKILPKKRRLSEVSDEDSGEESDDREGIDENNIIKRELPHMSSGQQEAQPPLPTESGQQHADLKYDMQQEEESSSENTADGDPLSNNSRPVNVKVEPDLMVMDKPPEHETVNLDPRQHIRKYESVQKPSGHVKAYFYTGMAAGTGRPRLRDIWPKVLAVPEFTAFHEAMDTNLGGQTREMEKRGGKVMFEKDKKYMYQCLVCWMMLTGWTPQVGRWKAESCVKTHIEQHNKEGIDLMGGVDCPFPGCSAPSVKVRGLINRHFSQHHSGKVCCTQCLEVVDAQPQDFLRKHFHTKHQTAAKKTIMCPQCGKQLRNASSLKQHIENIHEADKKKVVCGACGETFPSSVKLGKHMLSVHAPKNLKCLYCDKQFQNEKPVWERHLVTHYHLKPFKCSMCNYDSNRKGNIHVHVKNSHHKAYDPSYIIIDQDMRKKLNDTIRADLEKIRANANVESRSANKYKFMTDTSQE